MKIKFSEWEDIDWCIHQEMDIINGDAVEEVYVGPLWECPEDAVIGRDLISCKDILQYMKMAYKAGKAGEEFVVEEVPHDEN